MAIISMGYADGYLRTGSGKAQVLLGGVKSAVYFHLHGYIAWCAYSEGVDVHRGDEVTCSVLKKLDGRGRSRRGGAHHLLSAGCAISKRVPRFTSVIY